MFLNPRFFFGALYCTYQECQPLEIWNLETQFFIRSPPPRQTDPGPQWEWFRTSYEALLELHTIKIRNDHFLARNNLCRWLNMCKNAPETVVQITKIQFLRKKWAKSQTKAQKSLRDAFIRQIWWPAQERGRSVPYPGDSKIIQESWHVWLTCTLLNCQKI